MIHNYIENINRLFVTGNAREHSYRGDLQDLLNKIIDDKDIVVTNEPARIVNVGAPDYSITKKDIPIGYIEAKDINKPLNSKDYTEQFDRYKNALDNLIITDYMDFWFYKSGELTNKIAIAKIEDDKIVAVEENFLLFINNIKSFTTQISQTITSPSKLAKMMAGKARLLQNVIERAIISEDESDANNSLREQLEVFKATLIHDITPESFADIYAQTIAYGMFAARLHDDTMDTFTRQEAVFLIPKSNPFLRGLFNYVSGADCDDRIIWIIDSLAEIFLATDVKKLLDGFSQKSGMNDPIIHFYETFLSEYNPALRKSRGVWYTPQAVVNFIVRACDEVLKDEFDLSDGLSDETKIKIKVDDINAGYTKSGQKIKKELEVHKVQILDPATGTGTFLAETIKFIKKDFWGGSWSSYVEEHLIPRLNGFELLMASYAMAHLKLDLLLLETGYKPSKEQKRFNIFLTNSLEEHHEQSGNLFASYLANESKEADRVKKDVPVMVVMGNPPYSGHSSNKNDFIDKLLEDYKKESDGSKLKEKNPKWLNDDYVKFIRYSESYIEKNQEGVLGFITNNSYINNPTFRGMRYHLLKTFDKIYVIDLHGDSKKKETAPDGSKDENIFDIMQGVAIIIAIKKKQKNKKLAELYLCDIYGKRDFKYGFLTENSLKSLPFEKIEFKEPDFYFKSQNFQKLIEYEKNFKINELFTINSAGIVTARDGLVIDENEHKLKDKILNFYEDKEMILKENENFKIDKIRNNFSFDEKYIKMISHRIFDNKFIYYHSPFIERDRFNVMKHFNKNNLGIAISRQCQDDWKHIFISKNITDLNLTGTAGKFGSGYLCPLYLYPDENSLTNERTPNLNLEIVNEIEEKLTLKFLNEKIEDSATFAPIDILDYIYAVLHSPSYREKYKEFLKIDFPRVPYPKPETFWQLVSLGGKLRSLHLLEDTSLDERIIDIKGEGELLIKNSLNKKDFSIENAQVELRLNDEVSVVNIPLVAWEFYIGGYQPAQKWLKDRVGRVLSRADMKHYNRIINALCKTDLIMKKIDEVAKF
ncbi:type ISP restriction/modification enzyme [Arcobacter porcinus]|uniref:site-specific DNA-methyltransferase (adenine-specific) n=1 Tax=Arcobacter porcinus TaxID=1935204 RepID=A0A5C2HBR3_9BACT|nr:type ISP restriction/modification enzyme [Arcobacter porcinus]OCL87289.1 N-6 DNA Methylase [Arcobacter porcinus]OCL91436.1 N-6 DNA Methylase [Aliarcobacter thereius]QEP40249.1 type IIG restriction/modification system [Arcobacter porcinus]